MVTEDEARQRLLKILDDATTYDGLARTIEAEHAAKSGAIFGDVVKFFAESDPGGLDGELQERFAQVLSRFVESREALHLAGVLEGGKGG